MKSIISLILFSCAFLSVAAQINVPEGNFSIVFPNKNWKYFQTTKNENKSVNYTYAFLSADDSFGCEETPILRINIEPAEKYESTIDFSLQRFLQLPFSWTEQFMDDKRLPKNAVAFYGESTDSQGKMNKLAIIHFIHKKSAIELRFVTDESCFRQFENEIWEIIESIQLKSK